jgi:PAS domain S-box-containing protein
MSINFRIGHLGGVRSLRGRLVLLLSALLILLMVGTGVMFLSFIAASERNTWYNRQHEATDDAAQHVASFMAQSMAALKMIGQLRQSSIESDLHLLARLLRENPAMLEIAWLDAQGHWVAGHAKDRPVLGELFTTPQASWFHKAQAGEVYIGEMQLSATSEPYLILALPALEQGVVAVRLKMNLLWEVVRQIRFGESGSAYIVDHNGQIIAHPTPQVVVQRMLIAPLTGAVNTAGSDHHLYARYINFLGESVVGLRSPIAETTWTMVTELHYTEATAQFRLAIGIFLLTAVAVFCFTLWAMLYVLEQTVLKPLAILQIGTERVGQGDLTQQIAVARDDEFAIVARAFNTMVSQLFSREQQLITQSNVLANEITEHRRTEEALRRSEQTNRALLDAIPDALFRIDARGTIRDYRSSAEAPCFHRPDELLGRQLIDLLPAEMGEAAILAIQEALGSRTPQTFEFQLPSDNRAYEYEARFVNMDEQQLLAIVRDITERKRQEELLRANIERERQLSELKSRFITLMSHEFRTPLAIILTSGDLLERMVDKMAKEVRVRHFSTIRLQVHRLTKILDDLLSLNQTQTTHQILELNAVNFEEFCYALVQEFQPLAPEHRLLFTATAANRSVHLDTKLIRQAVTNLLSNAIKYSAAGSTVALDVSYNDNEATISVGDSGSGISEEDQKGLFTPFHRGQNAEHRPGLGLGLVIAQQAVRQHGGVMSYKSELSVGSVFTIHLPLTSDASQSAILDHIA